MSELKPCPFCGIKPELASLVTPVRYFYLCPNCGIGNELQGFDRDEARRFWNTRPIEDELRAELEKRTKALTMMDQFITHYNDAVSAGKVSVDVKPVQRPADPSLEEDE